MKTCLSGSSSKDLTSFRCPLCNAPASEISYSNSIDYMYTTKWKLTFACGKSMMITVLDIDFVNTEVPESVYRSFTEVWNRWHEKAKKKGRLFHFTSPKLLT